MASASTLAIEVKADIMSRRRQKVEAIFRRKVLAPHVAVDTPKERARR
jgi:hypothetical protein